MPTWGWLFASAPNSTAGKVKKICFGSDHGAAITSLSKLDMWGNNAHNQTIVPVTTIAGRKVTDIACGQNHTVAILDDGKVCIG